MLATALAFSMLTVTFNTIRLQILTQREVIEVSRLLGATEPFIRRPFLYYGALLGALGALAAWVVVWVGAYSVNHSLAELSQLYGSDFRLRPLAPEDSGSLLLFSTWLCWLGARLCVWQHLRSPEP